MDLSLQTGLSGWLISLLANAHRVFRINDLEQQKLLLAQSELIEAKNALERKSEELKQAAEHLGFLMQELSHRSKNLLAVIGAMASQSASTSASVEDFSQRFSLRLRGLAASHDLLVQQNWQSGELGELVARQLAAFAEKGDGRLDCDGPRVSLDAGAVQNLGLLLHELATNASKYGALSASGGKVIIRWNLDGPECKPRCLRLSWTERGGPLVTAPQHKGFGLVVIERMVAQALNGSVSVGFAPQGLACTFEIPAIHITGEPI
jgi:two-component sensor histidine kinase